MKRIIAKLFPCDLWDHWLKKGEQVGGCGVQAGTDNPVHWVTCHKCSYFSMRPYKKKEAP